MPKYRMKFRRSQYHDCEAMVEAPNPVAAEEKLRDGLADETVIETWAENSVPRIIEEISDTPEIKREDCVRIVRSGHDITMHPCLNGEDSPDLALAKSIVDALIWLGAQRTLDHIQDLWEAGSQYNPEEDE